MMTEKEWLGYPQEKPRTASRLAWFVGVLLLLILAASANAQVYQLETGAGQGSAVYVGAGVFVTAKHVLPFGGTGTVSDGRQKHPIHSVKRHPTEDLASFEVQANVRDQFTPTALVSEVPEGADATLCGFAPDRQDFCFQVAIFGDWLRADGDQHSLPGDSGGGVFVQTGRGKRCLAGVHFGYSCSRTTRCETRMVPAPVICEFLNTQYGNCPTCPQYTTPQPFQRPATQQPRQFSPQPQQSIVAGGCNVVVDYDRLSREFFDKYGDRLRGQDGANGRDGSNGTSPQLNIDELADVITSRYADRIRGQRGNDGSPGQRGKTGPAGQEGPRGFVGVPDDQDIRNWLIGASSDPETRAMLASVFADIVGADPRTQGLIERLEALERQQGQQQPDNRFSQLTTRLEKLEKPRRFMLVDGKTKTVLDDETYGPNDPFILDVQKIIRQGK